ncbi:hypothetical protein SUGI_0782050 [Cryptomeria japonica]|uniref:disease resistance protein RPS2-like n=1 Tax=Cryptomeria japonica TaxID=3369 RepID=UPI002414BEE2|nr:disease resistance protein RPS2-like [Cryptomeria japonica]GLJ38408.1 hypothetical protein SUGI_0782050 [Cryptomeria japonica]
MAELLIPVVAEAVFSIALNEAIKQVIKLRDKTKRVLHFKQDIEQLADHLKRLRVIQKSSMPDYKRYEVSPYAQNPRHKKLVKAIYKIAQDAEDIIQDCQHPRNWWHKYLLPFHVSARIKSIQQQIEILEIKGIQNGVEMMEGRAAADPPMIESANGVLSISISTRFESTTGEFRRTTLRLASMRRNSIKRRSQPIDVDPIGLHDQISEIQSLLLEDEEHNMLGIHGMGGAGKSLLMKCVWSSEDVQNSFENDALIWVTVSTGQISWLQRTIAEQIHMTFDQTWTEEKGKTEIFRHLETKRFFLVLDGVLPNESDRFLSHLGVPPNNSNGSKIVVISRHKSDLKKISPDMPLISVELLSEKDSWKLFKRYAFGSSTIESTLLPEVLDTAKKIASKCHGHPLALKAFAAAMAGQTDPRQWRLALGQTEADYSFFVNHTDAERRIFECLRSSYESLSPILRIAFLYFAAFPENHKVRTADLIDLWTAERLITAKSPSKLDAQGRWLLNIMIDRCVVEGVEAGSLDRVRKCKMHPMFRHLATHILEKEDEDDERCLFRAGDNLAEFPSKEISQHKHQRISLMYNRITCLPEEFKCRGLRSLILRHSERLSVIPPGFLKGLTWLRTLDLSMTGIESLPITLGRLKRLEYLNLSRTKLKCLPVAVTRLQRLLSLNLFECKELVSLPLEMNKLEDLRYLNLRRCAKLRLLPFEITQITSLQCLIMDGCDNLQWRLQSSPPENTSQYSQLEDLQSLKHLRYLSFVYATAEIPHDLLGKFQSLERLELCRGQSESLPEDIKEIKTLEDLRLSRLPRLVQLPRWLSNLAALRRITLEYLNVKVLPPAIFETLPLLRLLEIENCNELTKLPDEFGKEEAFPALEELRLQNLKALKELPALEDRSMNMLKEFRVRFCQEIKKFPKGVENLKKSTRIDIVGSFGLIRSVEDGGADRERLRDFLDSLNC